MKLAQLLGGDAIEACGLRNYSNSNKSKDTVFADWLGSSEDKPCITQLKKFIEIYTEFRWDRKNDFFEKALGDGSGNGELLVKKVNVYKDQLQDTIVHINKFLSVAKIYCKNNKIPLDGEKNRKVMGSDKKDLGMGGSDLVITGDLDGAAGQNRYLTVFSKDRALSKENLATQDLSLSGFLEKHCSVNTREENLAQKSAPKPLHSIHANYLMADQYTVPGLTFQTGVKNTKGGLINVSSTEKGPKLDPTASQTTGL